MGTVEQVFEQLGVIHTEDDCNICDNLAVTSGESRMAAKIVWGIIALLSIAASYILFFHPDYVVDGMPPSHSSISLVSGKDAIECTGHETTGRCADKCVDGSVPLGFDQVTGAAICDQPVAPAITIAPIPTPNYTEFVGK